MSAAQVVKGLEMRQGLQKLDEYQPLVDEYVNRYMPVTQFLLFEKMTYNLPEMDSLPQVTLQKVDQSSPPSTTITFPPTPPTPSQDASQQETKILPLPIVHCDIDSLDEINVRNALKEICSTLELGVLGVKPLMTPTTPDSLWDVPGLLNAPNAKILPCGDKPVEAVRAAIGHLQSVNHYGPYIILSNPSTLKEGSLPVDPFREEGEERIDTHSLYSLDLPPDRIIVFELRPETFRLVVGINPCVAQWREKWKALLMITPQPRLDLLGNSGIVIITK